MTKVYLVGAGPGDPELLTLKGKRLLGCADVVLFDHLANDALLALAPPHALRVYVGKKKADHAATQAEITAALIEHARAGKRVVRLKGGDPYLFGRGGEEVEALADAGIPFEVVPGVTTPVGLAAYTGVPLTHREHTSSVTFVTGHDPDKIDWALAGHAETLVIFMGLTTLGEIARRLIANGRSAETPAMAVRWATRPEQSTIVAPLGDIAARVAEAGLKPPATIVIGEVVGLRDRLNWFERLPLFGKRIVVTRAAPQAGEIAAPLRALGAAVIECPAIETSPAAHPAPLDAALAALDSYDWILFTSANGVRYFLDRLDASPADLRSIRARLCAIGPATRSALESLHLKVDLMPAEYVAEGVLRAFEGITLSGTRILLPRAAVARDVLPSELRRRGAHVDVVEAYRTTPPSGLEASVAQALAAKPDWITFTSSSTVTNFVDAAPPGALGDIRAAVIGPITAATARQRGLHVAVEANPYTVAGLVEALTR